MKNIYSKVAIYCRLSEEDRNKKNEFDDSLSIQNQKAMLIRHAQEKGWDIYQIYADDDYRGSDRNRPEFNRLLKDAEDGKFDIILCKTQSRFTREMELVEKYINGLFKEWNIRFVSIVDNADTSNKGNKKSRQINGLVNEWYLEDMSENIKSALTVRREKGLHIGAFALYGYQKDPEQKGHIVPDPEAAEVVQRIFSMYAIGIGMTAIARQMNEEGILNPTAYKIAKGIRTKINGKQMGTLWKYYTVSNMLTNEIYIGNMVQGKYESISYKTGICKPRDKSLWIKVPNTHEPIIDKELWNRVQDMRKGRFKPLVTGEVGPFANKLKCAYCGYNLRTKKCHGYRYFECGTRYTCKDACKGAFIPLSELQEVIKSELDQMIKEYLDEVSLTGMIEAEEKCESRIEVLQKRIKDAERKVSIAQAGIKELYTDKITGIISQDEFVNLSAAYRDEIEQVKYTLETLRRQMHQEQTRSKEESRNEILKRYISVEDTKVNRELVAALIEYIEVGRRLNRKENVPIIIHWNF